MVIEEKGGRASNLLRSSRRFRPPKFAAHAFHRARIVDPIIASKGIPAARTLEVCHEQA